jgi:hypothetical protein
MMTRTENTTDMTVKFNLLTLDRPAFALMFATAAILGGGNLLPAEKVHADELVDRAFQLADAFIARCKK